MTGGHPHDTALTAALSARTGRRPDPADPREAAYRRGASLLAAGHTRRAVRCLRWAALRGHPDAADALAERAYAQGDLPAAERWWGRAAAADHAGALHRLGTLQARRGEQRRAFGFLRAALQAGRPAAGGDLGVLLERGGRTPEARRAYR